MYTTLETVVRNACEQAIRSRWHDLADNMVEGGAARLAAKRTSLDLLSLALHEGRLDSIQMRLLEQLLEHYAHRLDTEPLPVWPGAEAAQLRARADERTSIDVALAFLRARAA